MNKRTILQLLGFGVIISALFLALTVSIDQNPEPQSENSPTEHTDSPERATVTITIEGLYDARSVEVPEGETPLGVLQELDTKDPELQLKTRSYGDMGTLVEGMHRKTNGANDRYWQYWVNDEMPLVGADAYALSAGDIIEWSFAPSEF